MTNRSKWLIAVPFALAVGVIVPALAAGDWLWFAGGWAGTLYMALSVGMWLAATAFVDVDKPRGKRDRANALIPLGLIVSVPLAVWDRVHGPAQHTPDAVSVAAVTLSAVAIALGVAARLSLGTAYTPRAAGASDHALVVAGPYRLIRHPLYLAALLWVIAWPLILGSIVASVVTLGFVLPAVLGRIRQEEAALLRAHGEAYATYQRRSWRLIPYIY